MRAILNNIDQTMGQMAGLIARICEDRRPSGRKRSKRSADPSSDTDESESEHHPRRSISKRARENTPQDDDVSLHAQDDLDEDLKLFAEQSSATD